MDISKARIAAKRYPKPKFRIAFLHQHGKTVNLWGQNLHGAQLNSSHSWSASLPHWGCKGGMTYGNF